MRFGNDDSAPFVLRYFVNLDEFMIWLQFGLKYFVSYFVNLDELGYAVC